MAIPCPIHHPNGWLLFQRNHPKDDYSRDFDIARNCCPDCTDALATPATSEDPKR